MASKHSNNDDEIQYHQRVSDFAAEHGRMLIPIKGYEKQPLVSLEEAVEPIVEHVPDVKQMVYVAKMRCKNPPADGLSVDESASIMLYSMEWEPHEECLYYVLNATLRLENRKKLVPWFRFLKLILTAFARLPSKHAFVYRGIKRDMRKEYPRGATIIWWGFSSCTSTMEVLENDEFLGSTGTRTFFTIECTSGKDICHHSYFQSENEIVFPPGRQFQVVSCLNQPSGLHMIQLKEIEPQYPLIELVSIEKLQKLINKNKGQSVVYLARMNLLDEDIKTICSNLLENNTTITILSLSGNQITDQGMKYLCNVLQNNKTLKELSLQSNQITDEGVEYLCSILQNNKTIKQLHLGNNRITNEGVKYLSNVLQNNKTITLFSIANHQITHEGVKYLSNALQNNRTLSDLWLSHNRIGDEGMKCLSNVLQNNEILTDVHLSNNQITDEGMKYLSNGLQNNKTLTHLDLSINQITDEGVKCLCSVLQNHKTIENLQLERNQITDEGVKYVSNVLQNSKTLEQLRLDNNQITDRGIQYLCNALENNRTLEELHLRYNQITDQGIEYLSNVLENNETLTRLFITQNSIGVKGQEILDKLKKKKSHLSIS